MATAGIVPSADLSREGASPCVHPWLARSTSSPYRGPAGSPGYDVFTTAQSLTIPPGVALPRGASYTWRARGSSAFSTVEEATGPGGFLAAAPAYRIAQSSTWPFTTSSASAAGRPP